MTTILYVLMEEYQRLSEAVRVFEDTLAGLPKGRPRVKCIHGGKYLYLNRREGARVVDAYVGRVDSDAAKEIQEQVAKRERVDRLLKDAKAQLKELKKVLRGKI